MAPARAVNRLAKSSSFLESIEKGCRRRHPEISRVYCVLIRENVPDYGIPDGLLVRYMYSNPLYSRVSDCGTLPKTAT
jgi:hypothetical protein